MYLGKTYIGEDNTYATLNPGKLGDVHRASLRVLEEVGMVVKHEGVRNMLIEAGALAEETRVYLTTDMVEQALRSAPSRAVLYDRNGKAAMFLEDRNVYYGPGSDTLHLIDYGSRKRRAWTQKDVTSAVRLCDALEHLDFVMSMGLISDVHRLMNTREQYAAMIRNSVKPQVVVCDTGEDFADVIAMAAAVRGGTEQLAKKPLFALYAEPTSPLVNTEDALDKLLMAAEHRIPTNYAQGGMAGGTTPITVAGTLVLGNAECLFGLVVHQLKNPGAPFIYGFGNAPLDMRSAQSAYAHPVGVQIQGGMCDLGRYYGLPIWGEAGNSSSKIADEQAAMEASQFILLAAKQGVNLCHDVGYVDFGLSFSFEMLAMCNEIIARTKETLKDIPVDPENLAFDVIEKIGPGGNFLKSKQTHAHMKTQWRGELSDFRGYDDWLAGGSLSMAERAHGKVEKILAEYTPESLNADVDAEIEKILAKAGKAL